MGILLLFLLAGIGSFSLRVCLSDARIRLFSLHEFAWFFLLTYCLVLLSSLPLVWLNSWSITKHLLSLFVLNLIPVLLAIRKLGQRKIDFEWVKFRPLTVLALSSATLLGIGLQWHSIYHLYSTHDPGSYLNAANYLHRTGRFLHENEIVREAGLGGKTRLRAVIAYEEALEGWLLSRNYGVNPQDSNKGVGSFHGVFATPLFLALGISLFGEKNLLSIHWVHLFVSLLLLLSILYRLLPHSPKWASLGGLLLVISPLIPITFRLPFSEALAMVFFLGILYACIEIQRDAHFGLSLLLFSILASLCVRGTGLLYLPPLVLALPCLTEKIESRARILYSLCVLVGTLLTLVVVFSSSGQYLVQSAEHYGSLLLPKRWDLKGVLGTPLLLGAFTAFWFWSVVGRVKILKLFSWLESPSRWRILWGIYFGVLLTGLFFRYWKLIFRLDGYIGGFPFIVYRVEALLFYVSPLVMILGFIFWFKFLYQHRISEGHFLHLFIPFCFFFYLVYHNNPLDVQPENLRYFIIELVPLFVIGAVVIGSQSLTRVSFHGVWAGFVFTTLWCVGINYFINRKDLCVGTYETYQSLGTQFKGLAEKGVRPVVIVVNPRWLNVAFLMPLSYSFGVPVVFAPHGFDFHEREAIAELVSLGYQPLFAIDREETREMSSLDYSLSEWQRIDHCYDYVKFGLAAPPLDLNQNCIRLSLQWPDKIRNVAKDHGPVVASAMRGVTYPHIAKHWFGVRVHGPSVCETPKAVLKATLLVDPGLSFSLPRVEVNGGEIREVWGIPLSDRKKTGHRVFLEVPINRFDCHQWNYLDIYFPKGEGRHPHATIASMPHLTLPK